MSGTEKRVGSKAFGDFLDEQFSSLRGYCLSESEAFKDALEELKRIDGLISKSNQFIQAAEDRHLSLFLMFREFIHDDITGEKAVLKSNSLKGKDLSGKLAAMIEQSSQNYFFQLIGNAEKRAHADRRLKDIWERAEAIQHWYWWPWKQDPLNPTSLFHPEGAAGQGPFLFGISYLHSELNSGFASPLRSRAAITHLTFKPFYHRKLPHSIRCEHLQAALEANSHTEALKVLKDQSYRSPVEDDFRHQLDWQLKPDYDYSKQTKTRPVDALFFCEQMKDSAASSGKSANTTVKELNDRLWAERLAAMGALGVDESFEQFISANATESRFRRFSWREHYSGYQTLTFVSESSRTAETAQDSGVDPVEEFFTNTTDAWTDKRRNADPKQDPQSVRHQRRATALDAFADVLKKDVWTGSVFGNYVHGANYLVFRFKDLLVQLHKAGVKLSALVEPDWMWARLPGRPRIMLDRQFIRLLERHREGNVVNLVELLKQCLEDQRYPLGGLTDAERRHADGRISDWGKDFGGDTSTGSGDGKDDYRYLLGAVRQMLTSHHPGHGDRNTAYQLAIYLLRSSLADHFGMYGILSRNFEISVSSVMGGRGLIVSNVRNNVSHWEEDSEAQDPDPKLLLKNFDLFTRTVLIDFGLNEYERGRIISSLTRYSSERIAPLSNVRGSRNAIMAITKINTEVEEAAARWRAGALGGTASQTPTPNELTAERTFLEQLTMLSRKLDYVDSSLPDGIEAAAATAAGTRMVLEQLLRQLDIGEVSGFTSLRTYTDRRIGKVIGVFEACGTRLIALRRRMKELRSQVGIDFEQDQTVDMRHILEQIDGITPFGRMYYGGSVAAGFLILLFLIWPSGEASPHHGSMDSAKYFLAAFGFALIALIWGGSNKPVPGPAPGKSGPAQSMSWFDRLDRTAKATRALIGDHNAVLRVLLIVFAAAMLVVYLWKTLSAG